MKKLLSMIAALLFAFAVILPASTVAAYDDDDEVCPTCGGTGDCVYCDGSGIADDGDDCDECDGSGECDTCDGTGYV